MVSESKESEKLKAKRKKGVFGAGLIGAAVCIALAGPVGLYAQDQIVAVVNKEVITEKDLFDFANFLHLQLSRQYQGEELQEKMESMIPGLLEKLIEDRLILQEASRLKVSVDDALVASRIAEIKKGYGSDDQFQAELQGQGLVQADLEKRIREQTMSLRVVEQQVRSRVLVKPDEVTRFYQQNPLEFATPEEREVDLVTVEDEKTADSVAYDMRRGITLEDIEKRYGITGSRLTVAQGSEFRADIQQAVFALSEGAVSGPLWLDGKYYVFRLRAVRSGEPVCLEEVRDRIFAYLSQKKTQEELEKWLSELKAKAYIKVMEPG